MEGKRTPNMEVFHKKEEHFMFGEACSSEIPIAVTV
jgi:hypothetical protein